MDEKTSPTQRLHAHKKSIEKSWHSFWFILEPATIISTPEFVTLQNIEGAHDRPPVPTPTYVT